ncbi:C-X-C motif chemokine 9 [Nothobranchius furzeri]|uniref:C-X-C motif chemokine 10-like n=1 Tax=Nothobranchius furzeri TaxID=105023 RepID=A0A8C6KIS3_NOTFU|nr:C-X-C motif chemokine 10 [Nothobranchius furzeri]KAF7219911.1 C-X-C motif chemokine 10-like [Nothobranchius furzeri]
MKLNLQAVCQVAFLSLCCLLTVGTQYVPGRCLCPQTQSGVRGQLKELRVLPQSATCGNVTIIVTLKSNDYDVCLNPNAPMGKQLLRCWNRAQKLGRDVKVCLKRRRRRRGQRQKQNLRAQGHKRRGLSSNPQ